MDSSQSKPCGAPTSAAPEARVTLEMGMGADPFSEQLERQGLPFDPAAISHLWLDAQAASRLKARGILAHGAGNAAYDKIAKGVWSEVRRADPTSVGMRDAIARECAPGTNETGAAEAEVGRWVYRRIEALMDAKAGTPEAAELTYLARVAESVEEYGEEACAGHPLADFSGGGGQ